jgi:5-methylthioadenosine/S-adenosylhomocysteine deaminase
MAATPQRVDLLITNGDVVTLDDTSHRYNPGSIAIEGSSIAAVGEANMMSARYIAEETIDASAMLVVPGMINTHTHLFQTPLKGLGNTLPLHAWIKNVPAATLLSMDDRSLYLAAIVGSIGALRSGTTTLLDYNYPNPRHEAYDSVLAGIRDSGIRALLGRGIADIASPEGYPVTGYHPDLVEPLEVAMEDCRRLHELCPVESSSRVTLCLSPPNLRALTPNAVAAMHEFAELHDVVISMHICESLRDDEVCRERYGCGVIEWLDKQSILNDRFVAVHCVYVDSSAIETFAEHGVNVSYNPVSNMYLGNGVAPIQQMRSAGVRVVLGTDGAAVNNNDLLESLKFGCLIERGAAKDPAAITAEMALRMATIEGARALGLEDSVGSIEPGKKADLLLVDLDNVRSAPFHDPIVSFVFSSDSSAVDTVVVDGRVLMRGGRLTHIEDEKDLVSEARASARQLALATGW